MNNREHIQALRDAVSTTPLTPILSRLQEVTEELVSLHRRLASLLESELKGKAHAFQQKEDSSVTARQEFAKFTQLDTSGEIITLRGEVAAFETERDFLKTCLEHKPNT